MELSRHIYHRSPVELVVTVSRLATRGVVDSPHVLLNVLAPGAAPDSVYEMIINEACRHLLHMQAAITRASSLYLPEGSR